MDVQRAHNIILNNPEVKKIRYRKYLGREIGKSVAMARKERSLTQSQLAELIGSQQSSIARLEKGESIPSLVFLNRIAEALSDPLLPPQFASQAKASVSEISSSSSQVEITVPEISEPQKTYNVSTLNGAVR